MQIDFVHLNLIAWLTWWACWILVGFGAKRNQRCEPLKCRLQHGVPLALGMGMLFSTVAIPPVVAFDWDDDARRYALCGTLAGFGFACWARYHLGSNWSGLVALKPDHSLVQTGPYRFVRHPIYTGLMIAAIATSMSVNCLSSVLGAVLCCYAFTIKLHHEERFLMRSFGKSYLQLCVAVPSRLVPRVY